MSERLDMDLRVALKFGVPCLVPDILPDDDRDVLQAYIEPAFAPGSFRVAEDQAAPLAHQFRAPTSSWRECPDDLVIREICAGVLGFLDETANIQLVAERE